MNCIIYLPAWLGSHCASPVPFCAVAPPSCWQLMEEEQASDHSICARRLTKALFKPEAWVKLCKLFSPHFPDKLLSVVLKRS